MRIVARFAKKDAINSISHLDTMRAIQRALRRAAVPIRYSQGFNPHPQLSFAAALGVGVSSEAEWMDVDMEDTMTEECFAEALAREMPKDMPLLETKTVSEKYPSLMSITAFADYEIRITATENIDCDLLQEKSAALLNETIMVMKKSKKGMQEVDIAPLIAGLGVEPSAQGSASNNFSLRLRCVHAPSGALNPLLFLPSWKTYCGVEGDERIGRKEIWAQKDGLPVPIYAL